jgi:TPR repeat protein
MAEFLGQTGTMEVCAGGAEVAHTGEDHRVRANQVGRLANHHRLGSNGSEGHLERGDVATAIVDYGYAAAHAYLQ